MEVCPLDLQINTVNPPVVMFSRKSPPNPGRSRYVSHREAKSPKGMSRRRFLLGASLFAGFALTGGLLTYLRRRPSTLELPYKGEIDDLYGKTLMSGARLKKMTELMITSRSPLFEMVAKRLIILRESTEIPSEFPIWVHPNTVPLAVTRDNSRYSYFIAYVAHGQTPGDLIAAYDTGFKTVLRLGKIQSCLCAINIGVTEDLLKGGSRKQKVAAEALLLAKEVITMLVSLRVAQEFFNLVHGKTVLFLNNDGSAIYDPIEQERAGAALFFQHMSGELNASVEDNPETWKILDAFPILFVSLVTDHLLRNGILPSKAQGMDPFYSVKNYVVQRRDTLEGPLNDFRDAWYVTGQLLPPPIETTNFIFSEPIRTACLEAHMLMYQNV